MDVNMFKILLEKVEPYLRPKKNCRPYDAISPKEKLSVVLEYLAGGCLQRYAASMYHISNQHFGKIIDQVYEAISMTLAIEIPPMTETGLIDAANDYNYRWNLPNCVGSIDGKHINIKCPPKSGSMFFNYKGFHSILLLGVADAKYRFSYLDVGAYGSEGNAVVFSASKLGKAVSDDSIPFPPEANVGNGKLPFFFIADDAFPIGKRILKPYVPKRNTAVESEEQIFYYRLSRARRCAENAYGSRWICLARTMFCSPDRAQKIVTACCHLLNFLINRHNSAYCPTRYADYIDGNGELVEGEWRKNISDNSLHNSSLRSASGRQNDAGKVLREVVKAYVNSPEGSVSWQRKPVYFE